MKYRLMDLLACPYDKTFPLELRILEVRKYEERTLSFKKKPACELFCAFKGRKVEELQGDPGCDECIKFEVAEGVLRCPTCNRWYPIIDEIPILLPDEMRDKHDDLEFLKKYESRLSRDVLEEGRPWNLGSQS